MTSLLPPRTHPRRSVVIRELHGKWRRWQERPSFRDTAKRLGISEAEVTAAHRGPCIRPIQLLEEEVLTSLASPGDWLLQVGDRNAYVQIRSVLGEAEHHPGELIWSGAKWSLSLVQAQSCHCYLMRRCCRSMQSHLMVCDRFGEAVLRLLPVEPLAQLGLQRLWERPDDLPIRQPRDREIAADQIANLDIGRRFHGLVAHAATNTQRVDVHVVQSDVVSLRFSGSVQPGLTDGRMISAQFGPIGMGLDLDTPIHNPDQVASSAAQHESNSDALQVSLPNGHWRLTPSVS